MVVRQSILLDLLIVILLTITTARVLTSAWFLDEFN